MKIKSKFIKSLAILASGSIVAQLMKIIASPVMTRLYSSEQIGEYTLALTIVGLFGSIICAQYDWVIVSEKDEKNVLSLCIISFVISLGLSVIISLISLGYFVICGYKFIQALFGSGSIFLLLFLQGVGNILISYNNRYCEYKLMTSVNLLRSISKEIIMILGGVICPKLWVLIFSEITGSVLGIGRQSKRLWENIKKIKLSDISVKELKRIILKHKKQALYSTPALWANNFSYSSINLVIDYLYGSSILGFYSITYRLLGLPLNIISSNVSRIYFEETSRIIEKEGEYFSAFLKTSFIMLIIAIPMTIILMICAPIICMTMFGEEYYVAGIYLRYLAPMYGIRFVVSPLSVGTIVSKKQNYDLYFQLGFVVMSGIAFFISMHSKLKIEVYLLMVSCLYSIVYFILYAVLFCFSRCKMELKK